MRETNLQTELKSFLTLCLILSSIISKSQNPFGNSLSFDGDEAHVAIPHHSSLNMTNTMTIEVRVWAADYDPGGWHEFVYKGGNAPFDTTGPREYYIRPQNNSGRAQFIIHDNQDNSYSSKSESALVNGKCYHLAGTYDGNVMKMYVNGVLEDIDTIGMITIQQGTDLLAFARLGSQSVEEFDGYLDEIRIWNIARNAEQICEFMNDTLGPEYYTAIDSGLVGYWRLDENSGTSTIDLSPNANHGTLVDGPLHISACNDIQGCTLTDIEPMAKHPMTQIYPNPSSGIFYLEIFNASENVEIKVSDIVGNNNTPVEIEDSSNEQYKIDLSAVASGVYIVNVKNGTTIVTKRIVVSK